MNRALYVCYFGLREPLVQTQVLPYLQELLKDGHEVKLLTFEPDMKTRWTTATIEQAKNRLGEKGIDWKCLPYHKRFSALATAYDILRGVIFVRQAIKADQIDILHCRIHPPALMAAIARIFSKRKPKILFDIRGFFPEEYVDAGVWRKNGLTVRTVKRIEKWLMNKSQGYVVLTNAARMVLFPDAVSPKQSIFSDAAGGFDTHDKPVEVIPCCVDFRRRFSEDGKIQRDEFRSKMGLENRLVVTHLGALGGLYLSEDIADFLAVAKERDPSLFAMFLTQSDPALIVPLLASRGFTKDDYFVGKVDPVDVQGYLFASDIGLSFVMATYATKSRSPTKIAEYLACGLPIVANRGVGDLDALLEDNGIGVLLNDLTREGYLQALTDLQKLGNVKEKCREIAVNKFDLETVGGVRYRRLYSRLLDTTEEK